MKFKNSYWILALALGGQGCQKLPPLVALTQETLVPARAFVNLQIINYVPATGHVFKEIFVSNFSVVASQGRLYYSTSRDSLSDSFKAAHLSDYDFSANSAISNASGLSDLFIYLAGITKIFQTFMSCPYALTQSSTGDVFTYSDARVLNAPTEIIGLRDCEKLNLQLDPNKFDNDGDGIPDYLELQCGLNPKNSLDAGLSTSSDAISNFLKCKRHIPVNENGTSKINKDLAYQYTTQQSQDGSYTFSIGNVSILSNSLNSSLNVGQDNFIAIYIVETNPSNNQLFLATGYSILSAGSNGKTLKANYWGNPPALLTNQAVVFQ